MNKEDLVPHDIALATQARAMYAQLFTDEDKSKIAGFRSTEDLITFLKHTEGWDTAAKALPPAGVTAELFSLEMERHLYREYERLYRFAQATAKDFLIFLALRARCRAILAALRRLSSPGTTVYTDPLPPFFHSLSGYNVDKITKSRNFDDLIEAVEDGVYGETLKKMERDPNTGLPRYSDAAIMLEERYYYVVHEFLLNRYEGPDKEGLMEAVAFKGDLIIVSYMLRLRRFNTPIETAMDILMPIPGNITDDEARAILSAETEEEVIRLVSRALRYKQFQELESLDERFLRMAEANFFRKIIHGRPTLRVAYAFLMLKEAECNMLKQVYVALQYGFDPEAYIV